jgi:predicted site-specific integrase-resolvase
MPAFRETGRLPEFERDLKRLCKRFRTLEEDLTTLMRAQIALYRSCALYTRSSGRKTRSNLSRYISRVTRKMR